jgi:putative ABC transport system ATP-binding protein
MNHLLTPADHTDGFLRFDDVSRVYGSGPTSVRALGPITLDIHAGELVAVMGPSGSGKTTLLSLAGALDKPTQGRVLLHGSELSALSPDDCSRLRRQTVGFVFQDLNLLPGLTALENVALPLELDGVAQIEAHDQAREALQGVQLLELADRFPENLSGGEQQRVAIARAFVGQRSLLLADEPTGALDSVTGEIIMQLLRDHCGRGKTAVVATHNSAHAAWADRVLFLRDGELINESN